MVPLNFKFRLKAPTNPKGNYVKCPSGNYKISALREKLK